MVRDRSTIQNIRERKQVATSRDTRADFGITARAAHEVAPKFEIASRPTGAEAEPCPHPVGVRRPGGQAKKRSAFLAGGLLGTAAFVVIYASAAGSAQ